MEYEAFSFSFLINLPNPIQIRPRFHFLLTLLNNQNRGHFNRRVLNGGQHKTDTPTPKV